MRIDELRGQLYTIDGERVLLQAEVVPSQFPVVPAEPVAMKIAAVGGADWMYDEIDGTGQKGVTGGVGLNNIGLVVRVKGQYWPRDQTMFMVSDGSPTLLKCLLPPGVEIDPLWTAGMNMTVTGVCSTEMVNEDLFPVVRVRTQGDIVAHL